MRARPSSHGLLMELHDVTRAITEDTAAEGERCIDVPSYEA